ncbi:hypothetical protein [Microbacterium sp.]|uniref:hypothetical protein n=1 Tax=Microbacterium sp. TaxID=51671 RepID=UPI003C74E23C
MSASQNRLTPAPVRQDAICMCARGGACSSFAPGHAVHLIQARLVSATPAEWVDAIVTTTDADEGSIVLHTLDGSTVALWNGAGASSAVTVGTPVAYHPRYHVLSVGATQFNALSL